MADGLTPASAAISYKDSAGFDIAAISTSGAVALTSGGAVTQSGAIAALSLDLLGTGPYTLDSVATNLVSSLTATTTGGAIAYKNNGSLSLAGVSTSDHDASFTSLNSGSLTVDGAINAGTGDVTLSSAGAISDSDTVSATITAASLTTNSASGTILDGHAGTSPIYSHVVPKFSGQNSTSGNIALSSDTPTLIIAATNSAAAGAVTVSGTGTLGLDGDVIAGSGAAVDLSSAGNMTIANNVTGPSGVTLTVTGANGLFTQSAGTIDGSDATLTVYADKMALGGTIGSASTDIAVLKPYRPAEAIDIGSNVDSTSDTLELTGAELSTVTGALTVGRSDETGAVTVSVATSRTSAGTTSLLNGSGGIVVNVALATAGDLSLTSGGAVACGTSGKLTAGTLGANALSISAASGIGAAGQHISCSAATISLANSTSNGIYLDDDKSFTIGSGSFVVSNSASGGAIVLSALGASSDLTLSGSTSPLLSGSGSISLSAGRHVVFSQDAGVTGVATTGSLTISAATSASTGAIQGNANSATDLSCGALVLSAAAGIGSANALETKATSVDAVNSASGDIQLAEADDIGVTRLSQSYASGTGNISLSTTNGSITVASAGSGVTNAGTGSVSLVAQTSGAAADVLVDKAVGASGGSITLSAARNFTMADGVSVTATGASGSIDITAGTSAGLSTVSAAAAGVTVTATNGSILDSTASITNVTGTTVSLTAKTGIGASGSGNDLGVAASTSFAADTSSGNGYQYLRAVGDVALGAVDAGSGSIVLTGSGKITRASGTITASSLSISATDNIGTSSAAPLTAAAATLASIASSSGAAYLSDSAASVLLTSGSASGAFWLSTTNSLSVASASSSGGTLTLVSTSADVNGSGAGPHASAGTIALTASAGIGNSTALALDGATSLSADTATGNIGLSYASPGTAVTATSLTTSGTGTISYAQGSGSGQRLNLTKVEAGTGAVSISNQYAGGTGGSIYVDSGSSNGIATSGAVTLTSAKDSIQAINSDANVEVSAATINLNAVNGGIGATNGFDVYPTTALNADTSTGGGDITITGRTASLPLGVVKAGTGTVSILSDGGALSDSTSGASTNLSCGTLSLSTSSGAVGDADYPIKTAVVTASVSAGTSGGVYLSEADDIAFSSLSTASGDIAVNAVGTVTVSDGVTATATSGDMTLTIKDLDLSSSGALQANSSSKTVSLIDKTGAGIGLGSTTVTGGLNLSGAELQRITTTGISFQSSGQILVDGISQANSANCGPLTLSSSDSVAGAVTFQTAASEFKALSVTASGASGTIVVNGLGTAPSTPEIKTDTGSLVLNSPTTFAGSDPIALTVATTLSFVSTATAASGQNVTLRSGDINLGGTFAVQGSGNLNLYGLDGTAAMNLGSSLAGGWELDDNEIGRLSGGTGNLAIGEASGSTKQAAAITAQTAGFPSAVNSMPLAITTTGAVNLDDDTGGTPGTALSRPAGGGSISISAGSGGILAAKVKSATYAELYTPGTISLTSGGAIGSGANPIQFASGQTGVAVAGAPSGVYLDGLGSLGLGAVTTGGGLLDATTQAGDLSLAAAVSTGAGTVTLTPSGSIYLDYNGLVVSTSGAKITFAKDVVLNANASITSGAGSGDVDFAGKVDSYTGYNYTLSVTAGSGAADFTGAVGRHHGHRRPHGDELGRDDDRRGPHDGRRGRREHHGGGSRDDHGRNRDDGRELGQGGYSAHGFTHDQRCDRRCGYRHSRPQFGGRFHGERFLGHWHGEDSRGHHDGQRGHHLQ